MRDLIYYVATSVDGYISGPNNDISGFVQGGNGVDQYLKDLQDFDTVIMGRKTYEFGYQYGLEKEKAAYPHMQNYVFSNKRDLKSNDEQLHILSLSLDAVQNILDKPGTPVYLCGGGQFAGWLLENQFITTLKLKLNPFIQGAGVSIFGDTTKFCHLELKDQKTYDHGLQIITYSIKY